ncbi:hypothetical protein N7463_002075 [Penicillium fimorum]|uniref:Uncharacterized protein n=1 Tax=Penicillium fimorum TaxID=1882269 RepID=A0A9X0C7Z9_9EURO|nr:hypothetical protein N7463_002075 [Penicillium fimorum]
MNTRQSIDESTGPYSLSATFNYDNTCFSVGLDTGFCVYNANPCELKVLRGRRLIFKSIMYQSMKELTLTVLFALQISMQASG